MGKRLIFVSNRLPFRVERNSGSESSRTNVSADNSPESSATNNAEDNGFTLTRTAGGLVAGLSPLHEQPGNLWVGWADPPAGLDATQRAHFDRALEAHGCLPVHLDTRDATDYYEGFSNSTLWPLFHGFAQSATFDAHAWEAYVRVNERFCDALLSVARPGDTIWVHDYHLMLLQPCYAARYQALPSGFSCTCPSPLATRFKCCHGAANCSAAC